MYVRNTIIIKYNMLNIKCDNYLTNKKCIIYYNLLFYYDYIRFGLWLYEGPHRPEAPRWPPEATCYGSELPGARPLLLRGPA